MRVSSRRVLRGAALCVVVLIMVLFTTALDFENGDPSTTETTTELTTEVPVSVTGLPTPLEPLKATKLEVRKKITSVQEEKMCNVKYPESTVQMLKRTLAVRGVRRVAILGNLRDCSHVLASIEEAILQVSDVLSPENVFVSFLESGSSANDPTPAYLRNMSVRFQAQGVSNVISTGHNRISTKWEWKADTHGSRINFLARLRNAAMVPAFYGHPEGHFDKFFFVNDVFICGGDILRLLAHDADIACGLDYASESPYVYDIWVMNTWKDLWPKHDLTHKSNNPISNVFACWNGGMASRALLWYSGMRFRNGMAELGREDCSQSECSIWAMDAHRLGFNNVILDPSIQVAYNWDAYKKNFNDSTAEVKSGVYSPRVENEVTGLNFSNVEYRCCELRASKSQINWHDCHVRALVSSPKTQCDQNPAKCLHYFPSRWEEDWDWRPLLKRGGGIQ